MVKRKRPVRDPRSIKAVISILSLLVALVLALPAIVNADTGLEMPPGFSETSPKDAFSPEMLIPSDIGTDTTAGWAYGDIVDMLAMGIVEGYPDGTFKPNKAVSRAEFASVLERALYLPDSDCEVEIPDVPKTSWAYKPIQNTFQYLPGYSNGSFLPNALLTREDVAASLVLVAGLEKEATDPSGISLIFKDYESISPDLRALVAIAVEQKLIKGYKVSNSVDGRYDNGTASDPSDDYDLYIKAQGFVTRAELCHLLANARDVAPFGYKVLPVGAK